MIQTEETILRNVVLHHISSETDKSILSNHPLDFEVGDEEQLLRNIFLKPFTSSSETFEFAHEIDLDYNVAFNLSKSVYEGDDFIDTSRKLAQHLIASSKHSNIKGGELFVVKFDDVRLGETYYEALGVYKFEEKDNFLKIGGQGKEISASFHKGIGGRKPDKACLVLFTEEPYTLLVIDNNLNATDYWQNAFIQLQVRNDNVNDTNNFLALTKKYITSQIPNEFEMNRADQINFLNRSVEYFKGREDFDRLSFEQEVFESRDIIDSFRKFNGEHRQESGIEISDHFLISQDAVKRQARIFKGILKLDKNFHIYIHGNKDLIERGVESDGRKYYKLYYKHES